MFRGQIKMEDKSPTSFHISHKMTLSILKSNLL